MNNLNVAKIQLNGSPYVINIETNLNQLLNKLKIKKTKKKLLNPFSLQPLADVYQNFKKKQKKEIANKIKREKKKQQKQL